MLILQSPTRTDAVLDALRDSVTHETEAIHIAVAYVTFQGARTLVECLRSELGETYDVIPKHIITCLDFGHTEPEALVYLRDAGFDVRIANLGAHGAIRLMPNSSAFHPKIFLAPTGTGAKLVTGSANLSRRALTVNTEAVVVSTLDDEEAWRGPWEALVAASVPMSTELLEGYRAVRPTRRRPPSDEPAVPPPVPPGTLPTFRDVVEAGLDPAEFTAFWIDVGYSSGGSGNQLELPRLANRFFGYHFDQYDDDQHTIGKPNLFTGNNEWHRLLTWHGNNRMERINLPTELQGGFEYRDRVILFERAGSRFEFAVVDADSVQAARWRDESAAARTLLRVSGRSTRLCGLI